MPRHSVEEPTQVEGTKRLIRPTYVDALTRLTRLTRVEGTTRIAWPTQGRKTYTMSIIIHHTTHRVVKQRKEGYVDNQDDTSWTYTPVVHHIV